MDRESVERLRFDRRLQRRSGWVEASELQTNQDALPDVSEKMTTAAELEAEELKAAEAAEAAAQAAPPVFETPSEPPAPAPVAGDFSSSPSYSSNTPSSFGGGTSLGTPGGSTSSGFGSDSDGSGSDGTDRE